MPASNQPAAEDLGAMSLPDLLDWRDALIGVLDEFDTHPKRVEARDMLVKTIAVIAERVRPTAEAAYTAKGKTSGSLTLAVPGAVVKADIPKKVEWDQDKLKAIAGELPWASVQQLFKITFNVPEAVYGNMLAGDLKEKLTAARTTKTGDIRINVERAAS